MARRAHGESMVSRVVRVLEAFDRRQSVLSAAEISQLAGLPIATTYRVINEMAAHGMLDKAPGGGFRTGVRLWELALRGSRTLDLRNAALPFMEDLQFVVRHHIQLAILDGTDVLYVERLSSNTSVVNITSVAGRLPARLCTPGLLLAAFSSPAVQERIIGSEAEPPTGNVVTDAQELTRIFARIRQEGYCRLDGWVDEGASGVSVPIRDATGEVIAALSAIVPNDGATPARTVTGLRMTAVSISRRLGWSAP
jgi:DNA-binding IclR family transcriptional regulator